MVEKQAILDALRAVMDPELGMSIVDLGMVRDVIVEGGKVEVQMVLTAPFCPLAELITEDARQAVEGLPDVQGATVTLLDEPWDPSWVLKK